MANNKQANKTWNELQSLIENIKDIVIPDLNNQIKDAGEVFIELKNGKDNLNDEIDSLHSKLEQTNELYSELFDDEDDDGETLVNKIRTGSKEIAANLVSSEKNFSMIQGSVDKIFGKENTQGVRSGGIISDFEKFKSRFDALFSQIEGLLPNAVSAGLASSFSLKVKEYEKESNRWKWISFWILVIIFLSAFFVLLDDLDKEFTLYTILMKTVLKIPFIIFAVWLIVYSNNRRAENKKLAELYKHKEVMASSYVGYKKQVDEIYADNDETELRDKLLSNLIDAISENSATFLASTGEKNPIQETIDKGAEVVKAVADKKTK